ncbi:MAG: cytochrome c oxidase subunit [Acidimicrobiaceae bacterium]|nr:cytochrome c oxidase subunit [Acidimicrobiaceae bacterium]
MSDTTDAASETPTAAGATTLTGSDTPAPVPADPGERHLVEEAVEHRRPTPEGGEHGAHPTDAQYMKIALVLAAITAVEVAIYYVKSDLGLGFAPILITMAAVKFFLVGAFFMHLRFDNRVLRRFFVTGIVLAIIIYVIVFLLLGVFTSTHGAHS